MKNNYLYQGWAGNTYSHKCTGNSKIIYYEFTDKVVNGEVNLLYTLLPLFASVKICQDGLEDHMSSIVMTNNNMICKQGAYLPVSIYGITYNTFEEACAALDPGFPITDVIKRRITEEEYWSLNVVLES